MSEEGVFTFTWVIENYCICSYKNGRGIASPKFTAGKQRGNGWYLKIYPGGFDVTSAEYISCFLCDLYSERNVPCECVMALISPNGDVLKSSRSAIDAYGEYNCKEERVIASWKKLIKIEQLKNKMNNWTEDILTVRCQIFTKEQTIDCEAKTTLSFDRVGFQWGISRPDTSDWKESRIFRLTEMFSIQVTLTSHEEDILVRIKQVKFKSRKVMCKLSLLDDEKVEIGSKSAEYLFDAKKDTIWNFPTFIKKTKLVYSGLYGFNHLILIFVVPNELYYSAYTNCAKHLISTSVDAIKPLQNDLRDMYINKTKADVKLRVDGKTFDAHKTLLSARSPVLSAIFDEDHIESQKGIVDIQGLDAKTMDIFLEFLYTGTLKEIDYNTSLKMMVAGCKYQVKSLVEKCALFLMSTITHDNVCDILFCADAAGHKLLKESALDYAVIHAGEILILPEWKQWSQKNPKLASEIIQVSIAFSVCS